MMQRHIRYRMTAILSILACLSAAVADFLPVNGNFAELLGAFPAGWVARGQVVLSQEESWQSSGVLRLSVRPGSFVTCVSPAIPVKTNSLYRFHWYCRTENFTGARAYAYLEIGKRQVVLPEVSIRGNSDWCEFSATYLARPGDTDLHLVLATHAYANPNAKLAAASFAGITVEENPPLQTLEENETVMQFPVIRAFGCQQSGNRYFLDPETYVQANDQNHLRMEAEKGKVTFQPEGGTRQDPDVTYIDFVANASYTFWVRQPGVYYRWLRTWRPEKARYCHHESINDEPPGDLLDDFVNKDREWEWVPGPAYEFKESGFHQFTLHNFYAGIRLDQILFTQDPDFDPTRELPAETPMHYPPQGELHTRSIKALPVQQWLSFHWPVSPLRAPAQLFWTQGDTEFQPISAETLPELFAGRRMTDALRFKLIIRPAEKDWRLSTLANFSVAAKACLRATLQPGQLLRLENSRQVLLFNRANGSLNGIFNKATSQWCYHQGTPSSTFALTLYNPQTGLSRTLPAEAFTLQNAQHDARTAEFTYHLDDPGLTVRCRYELSEAELSRWQIQVGNNSNRELVTKTLFPRFSSLSIGDHPGDDTMIFPQSYRKRLRAGEKALSEKACFPGSMAMGWVDLFDAKSGFYAAIDDPALLLTGMYAGTSRENGGFELRFEKNHAVAPGGEGCWDYIIAVHQGGWHWAADRYREMFSGWRRTVEQPAWLREANGLYCYSAQWQGSGLFRKLPAVYQQARSHGLDAIHVWGQQSYPKGPCGDAFYFPSPHFGTEEEFSAANRAIHELGGHAGYYQWMNWNVSYEDSPRVAFDTIEKSSLPADLYIPRKGYAADNQLITEAGKSHFFTLDSMKGQQCTLICATRQEHRDYLKYYTRRYAEKYHADGFYMDEGILKAQPCYNRRHGHCGNGETGAAMVEALSEMLTAGRAHNPDFFLTHEAPSCAAGTVSAHFVGVFEPDLDLIKYTFPEQVYLDGNLPVARRKQVFEGLRSVFLLGNQLMLFPFSGTFTGDSAALIQLRRQLRRFLAYARYRDTVGLKLSNDAVDCRRFEIDFAGNQGFLLTVSNPGQLSGVEVTLEDLVIPQPGATGFILNLDGSSLLASLNGSQPAKLTLSNDKISAVIVLFKVAPDWFLLPVLARHQQDDSLVYDITLLNLSSRETSGSWQLKLDQQQTPQAAFKINAAGMLQVRGKLPLNTAAGTWQRCEILINNENALFREIDYCRK